MIRKQYGIVFLLVIGVTVSGVCTSCRPEDTTRQDEELYHKELLQAALQECARHKHPMGDQALSRYYETKKRICWLEDLSDTVPVQYFLSTLSNIEDHGLSPSQFHYKELSQEYELLRSLTADSLRRVPQRVAALEYKLSESYLCYVRGLRFGFLDPYKLLNNLEESEPRYPGDEKKVMKELYDIPLERYDSLFLDKSLTQIGKALPVYLSSIFPQGPLYKSLMTGRPESAEEKKTRISMLEMIRWRTPEASSKGRRVCVNLAAQRLVAYEKANESVLEMKICCGSLRHKSPMLSSEITRMEVNPYWNVPISIVRREIIPGYYKDTAYFTQHRMKVYTRKGVEVSPHEVEWDAKAEEIPYKIRQNNGADNSLGAIVYRFPNKFDVYLHDTNNRAAFLRTNRAVSHGCIRLEKPLELLAFLEPDAARRAKIEDAMQPDDEGGYLLKNFSLPSSVPLLITYRTAGLDAQGMLVYYEDPYAYNGIVADKLQSVKPD